MDRSQEMKSPIRIAQFSLALFAAAGLALAQDQAQAPPSSPAPPAAPHAWRSINDPLPADIDQAGQPAPAPAPNFNAEPDQSAAQAFPAPAPPPAPPAPNAPPPPQNYPAYNPPPQAGPASPGGYNIPPRLTIKQGTYVTARINQWLSSDRNQKGDTFTATLEQPLVVDGYVVAQRGQTVYGRVTEAQKAGHVEGTSKLGVELTKITLADGNQVTVQSQMINRSGPTSNGRDAAAIGTTTALGAAIGAGVDWGRGAAIGAGAGAAAGILGVLLTRGRPTVIYPESVLTFQLEAPLDVDTYKSPLAFQYVTPQDYQNNGAPAAASRPGPPPAPGYAAPGYYPPYPYPYAYGYPYPSYGFGVYLGRGYYRGYYRGFYRR